MAKNKRLLKRFIGTDAYLAYPDTLLNRLKIRFLNKGGATISGPELVARENIERRTREIKKKLKTLSDLISKPHPEMKEEWFSIPGEGFRTIRDVEDVVDKAIKLLSSWQRKSKFFREGDEK